MCGILYIQQSCSTSFLVCIGHTGFGTVEESADDMGLAYPHLSVLRQEAVVHLFSLNMTAAALESLLFTSKKYDHKLLGLECTTGVDEWSAWNSGDVLL